MMRPLGMGGDMNPRFTHVTRAAVAAIVLSTTPVQSLSKTYDGPSNCSAPTTGEGQSSINYDSPGLTVQQPACQPDSQCTYPCEGDSTCDNPCPRQQPQSVPSPTEGDRTHHTGNGLWPFIVGVVAVGGIALAADQLTGKDWASSEELDANGPRFPIQQKLGRFQVQGYVAAGW